MNDALIRRVDAAALRRAGRRPETPFCVALGNGGEIVLHRLLRVLPGKRIVGEGAWNGRSVLVKLFVADASARHWAKERSGIEALRQAGLPTPGLLLAEPLPRGGHVLITEFLDGAQNLSVALPPDNAAMIDSLKPAFGLLGRMHAAGLVQDDLHLGNFLRHAGKLFVIDGDAVRVLSPGRALEEPRASANLAVLFAQLPPALDSGRGELLAAYVAGGGRHVAESEPIEPAIARVRNWRLQDFLRKTVRDCTLFSVRHGFYQFSAVRRENADRLSPLVETPQVLDERIARGILLKDGRTSTVARIDANGWPLVVKRYNLKNLRHALARFWRPSRAWHSWREGHRLRFLGIATPEPLAILEERVGPARRRAFLINEFCPGTDLLTLLSPDEEPAGVLGGAIVDLFFSLHAHRISHGDLKATNLLWHEGQVVLIDLDAVLQHGSARAYAPAWRRDRARLLRNWPASSVLHRWLDRSLPPA